VISGTIGIAAERQQDSQGQREGDAGNADHQGQHDAAELVGRDRLDNRAVADQEPTGDEGESHCIPEAVLAVGRPVVEHEIEGDRQQQERQVHPPSLVYGIEAVNEEVEALVDEGPAGARGHRLAVLAGFAGEGGIENRPVEEGRNREKDGRSGWVPGS
jgi:hypothetical protein